MTIHAFLYTSADWWLQSNTCKSDFEKHAGFTLKSQPLRASFFFLLSVSVILWICVGIHFSESTQELYQLCLTLSDVLMLYQNHRKAFLTLLLNNNTAFWQTYWMQLSYDHRTGHLACICRVADIFETLRGVSTRLFSQHLLSARVLQTPENQIIKMKLEGKPSNADYNTLLTFEKCCLGNYQLI